MPLPLQLVPVNLVQTSHQKLMEAHAARGSGDLKKAQDICSELLQQTPDYFGAHAALGIVFMQQGEFGLALPHLVRADMLNPDNASNLTNLGKTYMELGAGDRAVEALEHAIALHPESAMAHYVMGQAWAHRNDHPKSIEALERSLEIEPDNPAVQIRLAGSYVRMGRDGEARDLLVQALPRTSAAADRTEALYLLSHMDAGDTGVDVAAEVDALRKQLADTGSANVPRQPLFPGVPYMDVMLAYTGSEMLHREGKHADAWQGWAKPNKAIAKAIKSRRKTWFVQNEELMEKALGWKKPAGKSKGKSKATPHDKSPVSLFILGPSRSGKTTLESLLDELDGITRGYENNILRDTVRSVSRQASLLSEDNLVNLPGEHDEAFAQAYHAELEDMARGHAAVTVTHPGAIPDCGRLSELVPNARFVFMRRDKDDTAARIFTQLYRPFRNDYAYDMADIDEYLSHYDRMIDHWLGVLGDRCVEVTYEELVSDPASVLGKVANLCGLKAPAKIEKSVHDDRGFSEPYKDEMKAARDA